MDKIQKYELCNNVVLTNMNTENLGRNDLLTWINKAANVSVTQVQDLCSGAPYCVLMDILFPGSISLKKVKLNANQEHEYLSNWRELETAFKNVGCKKFLPIDKIIKGRFQDNLEFLQYFKKFYDANVGEERSGADVSGTSGSKMTPGHPRAKFGPVSKYSHIVAPSASESLKRQVAQLNVSMSHSEKERAFYYEKLRQVEVMCVESTNTSENRDPVLTSWDKDTLVKNILEVLYKTEEGFGIVEDDVPPDNEDAK